MAMLSIHVCVPQDSSHCEQWGEEAVEMYARAVNGPMKNNLLVNFTYADYEEVVCACVHVCVHVYMCACVCVHMAEKIYLMFSSLCSFREEDCTTVQKASIKSC